MLVFLPIDITSSSIEIDYEIFILIFLNVMTQVFMISIRQNIRITLQHLSIGKNNFLLLSSRTLGT